MLQVKADERYCELLHRWYKPMAASQQIESSQRSTHFVPTCIPATFDSNDKHETIELVLDFVGEFANEIAQRHLAAASVKKNSSKLCPTVCDFKNNKTISTTCETIYTRTAERAMVMIICTTTMIIYSNASYTLQGSAGVGGGPLSLSLPTVYNFLSALMSHYSIFTCQLESILRSNHEQRIVFVWVGCGFCEEAMILYMFANRIRANVFLHLIEIKCVDLYYYY